MLKKQPLVWIAMICTIFFSQNSFAKVQGLYPAATPEFTLTATITPNVPATLESDILTKVAPARDTRKPTPNFLATEWAQNNQQMTEKQGNIEYLLFLSIGIALLALLISVVTAFMFWKNKTESKENFAPKVSPETAVKQIVPPVKDTGGIVSSGEDVAANLTIQTQATTKNIVMFIVTLLPVIGLIIGFIIFMVSQK